MTGIIINTESATTNPTDQFRHICRRDVKLDDSEVVHYRPKRDSEVPRAFILLPNYRHNNEPYGGDELVVYGAQADRRCPRCVTLTWRIGTRNDKCGVQSVF